MNGRNEEIVGEALKDRRDKIYVATKTRPSSTSKADVIRDVEESLRALGTDYIDVIQLHNLTGKERIYVAETREALVTLRQQGKARFFGVTTHKNQVEVLDALVNDPDRLFDMALVAYNFKSGLEIGKAIRRAAEAKIGIVAMKTQAGGYVTDALGPISPHQAALKWALQNEHITAAVPGMRDMAELREDIAVMGRSFGYLDKVILKQYGNAIRPYYCRLCGECEATCPSGVEIGTINRCLMYEEAYGNSELARMTYGEIPSGASASACLDCSNCTARCVDGLDIGVKMERARMLSA
jgi:hypothetical protein